MLRLILKFYEKSRQAVNSGVPLSDILSLGVREDLARIKIIRADEFDEMSVKINEKIDKEFGQLVKEDSLAYWDHAVTGKLGGRSQFGFDVHKAHLKNIKYARRR